MKHLFVAKNVLSVVLICSNNNLRTVCGKTIKFGKKVGIPNEKKNAFGSGLETNW